MFNGNRFGVLAVLFLVIGFFGCYHSKIAMAENAPREYPSSGNSGGFVLPRAATPVPIQTGQAVDPSATDIRTDEPIAPPQAPQVSQSIELAQNEGHKRTVRNTEPLPDETDNKMRLKGASGSEVTTSSQIVEIGSLESKLQEGLGAIEARREALKAARVKHEEKMHATKTMADPRAKTNKVLELKVECASLDLEGAKVEQAFADLRDIKIETLKRKKELQAAQEREKEAQKAEAAAQAEIAVTRAAVIELGNHAIDAVKTAQGTAPVTVAAE